MTLNMLLSSFQARKAISGIILDEPLAGLQDRDAAYGLSPCHYVDDSLSVGPCCFYKSCIEPLTEALYEEVQSRSCQAATWLHGQSTGGLVGLQRSRPEV